MGFEKPQITPRRRIEVPEEARQQARAGMGGEATRTATTPPAAVEPIAPPAPVAAPAAPAPEATPLAAAPEPAAAPVATPAAAPVKAPSRGRKPATAAAPAPEAEVPLHTVQIAKSVVQEIKMSLLLAAPGPDTPTTIKNYLEAAHRHYDAYLRKAGKLPPTK
ncbi:hypothetical protein H8B13_19955 [Hymenobacter sp. BT188]|uniref:hypothetical protein n=1 Tax=Hymenobacter sp. BT188 TaxID=2763504 RepID=UPI001650F4DA|nr:hypothetical protein [Hymenobacter sp. BT188]MBC6609103.1 hypothetical protein [Hymenobacter sp. BT188]